MHHLASSTLGVQRTFRNLSLKTEQEGSRGIWQKDRIHRKKKNGTGWANREVKHKVSGSRELMNWVRNRGENNYSMVKGGINRDLDEISIKGTRGGWGKESN